MAAIKEYNSTLADSGLSPTQLGISATEAAASAQERTASVAVSTGSRIRQSLDEAGRSIGSGVDALGSAAGKIYQQYVEQPDINQVALATTKKSLEISALWDDALKNAPLGGGTKAQAKFLNEDLENHLDDLVESAQTKAGKQYAFDEAVKLRDHMFKATTADVSTRAGQELLTALDEQKNLLSNDVYRHPDKLDLNLALLHGSVEARVKSAPGLSASTAAQVQNTIREHTAKELVNSAFLGLANQDADKARELMASGKYDKYISNSDVDGMIKTAENLNRARNAAIRADQDRARQDKVNTGINTINSNITDPTTGKINVTPQSVEDLRKIINADPTANPDLFRAQFGFMNSRLKESKVHEDDPEVVNDLTTRLFSKDNPTTELQIIQAGQKMSDGTYTRLRQNVKDLQELATKEPVVAKVLDGVKADMTYAVPGAPGTDPVGMQNYGDFTRKFIPEYLAAVRSGQAKPDDLDVKNPDSMIRKAMKPYERTMEQRVLDRYRELGEGDASPLDKLKKAMPGLLYSESTKMYYSPDGKHKYTADGIEVVK